MMLRYELNIQKATCMARIERVSIRSQYVELTRLFNNLLSACASRRFPGVPANPCR